MWAETCKYLSVIHNVNHRRRQRDRRGRGKGTEGWGGKREKKKRGVKNEGVGEDGGEKAHSIWRRPARLTE